MLKIIVPNGVLGTRCLAQHTEWCPYFSLVPTATPKASRGLLKGAVHTETMCENSYKDFNKNQGKQGGIIYCCASDAFLF